MNWRGEVFYVPWAVHVWMKMAIQKRVDQMFLFMAAQQTPWFTWGGGERINGSQCEFGTKRPSFSRAENRRSVPTARPKLNALRPKH
jgi:hypothetical protein